MPKGKRRNNGLGDDGQALARALVDRSDVFVDGWGTGVATRLGLDAEHLRRSNPRLVHARISAFRDHSPLAALKGWESIVMAAIGGSTSFSLLTSRPGPAFVSAPFCSVAAAHHARQGILGALTERERSGEAQGVAVSLAHSFLAYDTWNWLLLLLAGELYYAASPAEIDALVEESVAIARRIGDPRLLTGTLLYGFATIWRRGTTDVRRAMATEALGLARQDVVTLGRFLERGEQ